MVEAPNGDVVETIFEPRLWRRHNEYRYHGRSLEAVRWPDSAIFTYHDGIYIGRASVHGTDEEIRAEYQLKMSLLERQFEETRTIDIPGIRLR